MSRVIAGDAAVVQQQLGCSADRDGFAGIEGDSSPHAPLSPRPSRDRSQRCSRRSVPSCRSGERRPDCSCSRPCHHRGVAGVVGDGGAIEVEVHSSPPKREVCGGSRLLSERCTDRVGVEGQCARSGAADIGRNAAVVQSASVGKDPAAVLTTTFSAEIDLRSVTVLPGPTSPLPGHYSHCRMSRSRRSWARSYRFAGCRPGLVVTPFRTAQHCRRGQPIRY